MSDRGVTSAIIVVLALAAVSCSGGDGDPLGEPAFDLAPPRTRALVFAEGSDREEPTAAVVVAAPDGSVRHRIAMSDRLVRLRRTASRTHAVVLSRGSEAQTTAIAVLDVQSGETRDLTLPSGDWDAVRLLGTPRVAPGSLTVLVDRAARRVAIVDLRAATATVVDDVPDEGTRAAPNAAAPALRMAPSGDVAVLTMPDGARVVGIEGGSRRLSGPEDDFTFVRWLGNGRALEYVRTTPGDDPVLTAELAAGGEPERVNLGQIDAALPTRRGLVIVRERTVWLVERGGPRELLTGEGPFVLPVAASGSGGHILVFDGAGGGFEHLVVSTTDGTVRTVELPPGANAVPGLAGGDQVWLASGNGEGPVLTLDLPAAEVTEVFTPPADQPVDPTLVRPAPDGAHAVARVGTSLTALALRAVLLPAGGGAPVELARGRDASGVFSPEGRYVATTWDPVENPVNRKGRVAIYDTATDDMTDLGPAHEAIWVGA